MGLVLSDTLLTGGVSQPGATDLNNTSTPSAVPGNLGVVFGALAQSFGAFSSGSIQRSNARFQAELAEINARSAERAAQSEIKRGAKQAGRIRLRGEQTKSTQRASFAANGVRLSSASVAETLTSTDVMAEADAHTAEENALNNAWGYRTQASNASARGAAAKSAAPNPGLAAASSLLTGAGAVARNWYNSRRVS